MRARTIKNIRIKTALRGDSLEIDLGKVFEGELRSNMKHSKTGAIRTFDIRDGRYLSLENYKTRDYISLETGSLIESILGVWHFDVEQTINEKINTIYTGKINFIEDVTGDNYATVSYEEIQYELQYIL